MSQNIVADVINLIMESDRQMPAHYTSGNGRSQTFLVDFDGLSADDEYQMAGTAWYCQPPIKSENERYSMVKIAEDIMLGSYILTKMGYKDLVNQLKTEFVTFEISLFPDDLQSKLKKLVKTELVENYFNMCSNFGMERADGK